MVSAYRGCDWLAKVNTRKVQTPPEPPGLPSDRSTSELRDLRTSRDRANICNSGPPCLFIRRRSRFPLVSTDPERNYSLHVHVATRTQSIITLSQAVNVISGPLRPISRVLCIPDKICDELHQGTEEFEMSCALLHVDLGLLSAGHVRSPPQHHIGEPLSNPQ